MPATLSWTPPAPLPGFYPPGQCPRQPELLFLHPSHLLHLDPFSFTDPNELALSFSPLTARFNAELAYGFPTANHALLTPYIDAHLAHSSNTYTTGLRYQLDSGLNLDLSASHRQRSSGNNDNRFFLQLRSDL